MPRVAVPVASHAAASASRCPSISTSKRRCAVRSSTSSSEAVSRSISSVPRPRSRSAPATYRLRGLKRLLPLPCAKSTMPRAPGGTARSPSSTTPPAGTRTKYPISAGVGGILALRARKQLPDLIIAGLLEVFVPFPDGLKVGRRHQADQLVHFAPQHVARARRSHRHCDYDAPGLLLPQRCHGRAHGRAGRQTVVAQNRGAAAQLGRRPVAAVLALAAFELGLFARGDALNRLFRYPQLENDVAVHHADAARGDRAHRQLFVPRDTELAHQENVERRLQRVSHLIADRHA